MVSASIGRGADRRPSSYGPDDVKTTVRSIGLVTSFCTTAEVPLRHPCVNILSK
jgi:hypothetical protein